MFYEKNHFAEGIQYIFYSYTIMLSCSYGLLLKIIVEGIFNRFLLMIIQTMLFRPITSNMAACTPVASTGSTEVQLTYD